jgi:Protein of unknown function (DUF1588)
MQRISVLLFAAALAAPACTTGGSSGDDGTTATCGNGVCDSGETEASCPADCSQAGDQWDQTLNSRVVDYNAALRIASMRLTGSLPSMADINSVANAPTDDAKKTAYVALINQYIATPAFTQQIMGYWRDTFKEGGTAVLDTAPAFAAQLTLADGDYRQLFTASSGNCPTYDGMTTFTPGECANGGPKSGVLTDPGTMTQFYSNFAFRRTRWVQETFVCTAFPAEVSATPTDVHAAAPYTGVFPFASIAGADNGGRIDFHDVSATICANCHSNINHIAPLFANYDVNGMYQTAIAVTTPLDGAPLAKLSDYLPAGEGLAWRFGTPVSDLPTLGAAMAADPQVAACGVARVWNWALGKTDIVDTLQQVPNATIQTQIDAFTASGYKIKSLILAVYTSDDFVKF